MTNHNQTNDMQLELYINNAIDHRLNEILRQMQSLIDESRIWKSNMEVNQFQNLSAVTQETNSVEVVKNFIRYQIGRDSGSRSWRRSGSPAFGEQIIGAIDQLEETARGIVTEVGGEDTDIEETWMKLTRLYIGYLNRYFYYKKRS